MDGLYILKLFIVETLEFFLLLFESAALEEEGIENSSDPAYREKIGCSLKNRISALHHFDRGEPVAEEVSYFVRAGDVCSFALGYPGDSLEICVAILAACEDELRKSAVAFGILLTFKEAFYKLVYVVVEILQTIACNNIVYESFIHIRMISAEYVKICEKTYTASFGDKVLVKVNKQVKIEIFITEDVAMLAFTVSLCLCEGIFKEAMESGL